METTTQQRRNYEEPFKQAAVDFFLRSGKPMEAVAAELGLDTTDLRKWQRKYKPAPPQKRQLTFSGVAQLKAENQALRQEIVNLKVQWDILKTTLGILSSGASAQERSI